MFDPSDESRIKKHILPDKDLRFTVKIRVYGQYLGENFSHGYLLDDTPLGVSPPIGEFVLDATQVTFKKLRYMIEYNNTTAGHMKKRSLMFAEALFLMNRMPNLHNRPKEELNRYQFGFIKKSGEDIKLIHPEREVEPIASLIGRTDFFEHDLVIVPFSQIPPEPEPAVDAQSVVDSSEN